MSASIAAKDREELDILTAGHLCVDVIPSFEAAAQAAELLPGRLLEVGPATFTTGGAVSNVGLSLQRLGMRVRLMGSVGDDAYAQTIRSVLQQHDPALLEAIRSRPEYSTSYTIVINLPGRDRSFLHHPGCNDHYGLEDIDSSMLQRARLLHFGYPSLMKRLYSNGGADLEAMLAHIKASGITLSLDMSMPDTASAAGRVDWPALLQRCLPYVDVFLPSLPEIYFMLYADIYPHDEQHRPETALLEDIAERLLVYGVGIVGLKLGAQGFYLQSGKAERLARMGKLVAAAPQAWLAQWTTRQLWAPSFTADVQGTTGAGDAAIAGLLASMLHYHNPEESLRMACALGACSVEAPDAVSGVSSWQATQARLHSGWATRPLALPAAWTLLPSGVYRGAHDNTASTA